jgi:arylformamidase
LPFSPEPDNVCGVTDSSGMRLVDLTHVVENGMVTYPGLPAPQITDHLSWEDSHGRYAPGTEFQIGRITMVANTGTYLDSPAHRHRGSADLADLELERVAALPGVVVVAPDGATEIGPSLFAGLDLAGRAVLVRTGWDRHWRTDAYGGPDAPFLSAAAAHLLVGGRAALVGIDALNIDSTSDGERPVHTILLAAGIPVLEHLTGLQNLPSVGFELHAAPVPVRGMGTFPVRAYAVVRQH